VLYASTRVSAQYTYRGGGCLHTLRETACTRQAGWDAWAGNTAPALQRSRANTHPAGGVAAPRVHAGAGTRFAYVLLARGRPGGHTTPQHQACSGQTYGTQLCFKPPVPPPPPRAASQPVHKPNSLQGMAVQAAWRDVVVYMACMQPKHAASKHAASHNTPVFVCGAHIGCGPVHTRPCGSTREQQH
jgi:hypothetical protein